MDMNIYAPLSLLLLTAALSSASNNKVDVLKLPDTSDWEKQVFSGATSYDSSFGVQNSRNQVESTIHSYSKRRVTASS